jgi:uncharacterized membrane protein YdfJ with MMPL/SSD domain
MFLAVLVVNSFWLASICWVLRRPIKKVDTAAEKLEKATHSVEEASQFLFAAKNYQSLAESQRQQTKNAIEMIPTQVETKVEETLQRVIAEHHTTNEGGQGGQGGTGGPGGGTGGAGGGGSHKTLLFCRRF